MSLRYRLYKLFNRLESRVVERFAMVKGFLSDNPLFVFLVTHLSMVLLFLEINDFKLLSILFGVVTVALLCLYKLRIILFVWSGILLSFLVVSVSIYNEKKDVESLNAYIGQKVEATVFIAAEPYNRSDSADLVLNILEVDGNLSGRKVRAIAKVSSFPRKKYGQVCKITGILESPKNFGDFNYIEFLKNKKTYYLFKYPMIYCEEGIYDSVFVRSRAKLLSLKNVLVSKIETLIPEPQSSLLIGIFFGDKRYFPEEFDSAVKATGTSHIVAASGYNITILLLALEGLLANVPRKYRLVLQIIIIWLYVILAGVAPSITRAGLMSTLVLIAGLSGSLTQIHYVLLWTAFLYTLFNPRILLDISFQLSIISTASLVYLLPVVKHLLGNYENQWLDTLLATVSCTIATSPISVFSFKKFSTVSILTNLLILPVIESTMLIGVLAIAISYISELMGKVLLMVVWGQLKFFEIVVQVFGGLDFALLSIEVSSSGYYMLIVYLFAFVVLILSYPEQLLKDNYYFKQGYIKSDQNL